MRFTIRMCVIPAFVALLLSISRRSLSTGGVFVLSGGYVRSEPNVGMDSYGFYFYGLSVVKSFLKDKLTCTLRAQDFLGDHKTIQINERYPDFHIRQTERMFSRGFGIAINYRIGDLKASVKKAGRSIGMMICWTPR